MAAAGGKRSVVRESWNLELPDRTESRDRVGEGNREQPIDTNGLKGAARDGAGERTFKRGRTGGAGRTAGGASPGNRAKVGRINETEGAAGRAECPFAVEHGG